MSAIWPCIFCFSLFVFIFYSLLYIFSSQIDNKTRNAIKQCRCHNGEALQMATTWPTSAKITACFQSSK